MLLNPITDTIKCRRLLNLSGTLKNHEGPQRRRLRNNIAYTGVEFYMDITELTLLEIAGMLKTKQISSEELLNHYIGRVEEHDPKVKSFLEIDVEGATAAAKEWDNKRVAGDDVPLFAGVPMAVKNNIMDKRMVTDAASKILSGFVSPYEATVVTQLQQHGFVLFGKLNLDEFAMGSSTENSSHFTTHNPWNLDYSPGGSSGGPAAAIAARLTPITLGSDTGGSIRQPASFCGVTGFKPSYGRVSRYGVIAFASSLDQVGPMTVSAKDSALVMDIIGQHDPKDSTSYKVGHVDYLAHLDESVKGLRLGVPKEAVEHLDEEALATFKDSISKLQSLGCIVDEVSLAQLEYSIPSYYVIAPAEAAANLARYDGIKYGKCSDAQTLEELYLATRTEYIGEEVQRRIMLGNLALSSKETGGDYYLKAQKVRQLIRNDFHAAFEKFDLLISPTSPISPFKIGDKTEDAMAMYYSDLLTLPSSLYGGPAISIPAGFNSDGMPMGLQIMGAVFHDSKVLQLANAFQAITDFHSQIPKGFK